MATKKNKVLIFCEPILEDEVLSLVEENAEIAHSVDMQGVINEVYSDNIKTLILFDKMPNATDGDYIAAARTLSPEGIRVLLVSKAEYRQTPSIFFTRLFDAGCKEIICPPQGPLSWMQPLAKAIYSQIPEEEVLKLCQLADGQKSEAKKDDIKEQTQAASALQIEEATQEQLDEVTRLYDAGDISDEIFSAASSMSKSETQHIIEMAQHAEKIRLDADENLRQAYEQMKRDANSRIGRVEFINICQGSMREGSTHLSLGIARALSLINKKVAVVLPMYHLQQLRENYSKCPYDVERQCMRINKIDFYAGEAPTAAPDGYEIVICDFGCAKWLGSVSGKEEIKAAQTKANFYNANVKILSSFVAPTGDWSARAKIMRNMNKKDLDRTTFAVFGMQTEAMFEAYRQDISSEHGKVRVVNIGYLPSPLMCTSVSQIDDGVKNIASMVLTKNDSKKLFPQDIEEEIEEVAEDSARKKRSFFNFGGAR